MSRSKDDPGASYMPERYRQQIEAKKRRQLVVRLAAVAIVILVCVAILLFLLGPGPAPVTPGLNTTPPEPTTPIITTVTSSVIPITTSSNMSTATPIATSVTPGPVLSRALVAAQQETGILPFDRASAYLREDYPASTYTIISADITGLSPGKRLYAFAIRPVPGQPTGATTTVYVDSVTGDPYTPGQENAGVPLERAGNAVTDLFAGLHPEQTRIRYTTGAGGVSFWNFTLIRNNTSILSGALESGTGQIVTFSRIIDASGRPSLPVLDAEAAQAIADRYISDRNGPVAVNLSDEYYVPLGTGSVTLAGQYIMNYNRMVQGYPCDVDGFTESVDSVTGEIAGYERRWSDPEYAFEVSPVPTVLKREATYTVLKKAQDTYPGLANGITIRSAEIRWKDGHPAGTVPRPSGIPLAWKIVFDDELIRSAQPPVPAVAWVDVHTGSLLEFDYQH